MLAWLALLILVVTTCFSSETRLRQGAIVAGIMFVIAYAHDPVIVITNLLIVAAHSFRLWAAARVEKKD